MVQVMRLLVLVCVAALAACVSAPRVEPPPAAKKTPVEKPAVLATGLASYYGGVFHGRLTASGERFDKEAMTAAHRTLPFGTCVRVQRVDNARSVRVRVNDRGPFKPGRVIDISEGAARRIGLINEGLTKVRLLECDRPPARPARRPT